MLFSLPPRAYEGSGAVAESIVAPAKQVLALWRGALGVDGVATRGKSASGDLLRDFGRSPGLLTGHR
jgi:hypothetical protein